MLHERLPVVPLWARAVKVAAHIRPQRIKR
jgi:hypothetical protein